MRVSIFSYGSSSSDVFKLLTLLSPLFGVIYLHVLKAAGGCPASWVSSHHGNVVLIRKAKWRNLPHGLCLTIFDMALP